MNIHSNKFENSIQFKIFVKMNFKHWTYETSQLSDDIYIKP